MSIKKISKIQPQSFEFSKDNLLEVENEIKKFHGSINTPF